LPGDALLFGLLFALFEFMGRTPEVFWFPLLFCTTPTFAGAVFEFRFELTFAELLLEVVLLQPPRPTTASRHITT